MIASFALAVLLFAPPPDTRVPPALERAYLAGSWDAFCDGACARLAQGDESDSLPSLSLLVGKAEAARGNPSAARAAFTRVLEGGVDGTLRTEARIGIARAFLSEGETRAARRILTTMRGETEVEAYRAEVESILDPRRSATAPRSEPAPRAAAGDLSRGGRWWIQMASGSSQAGAERQLRALRAGPGRPAGRVHRERSRWLVLLGPYESRAAADRARADLARRGKRGVVREVRIAGR